MKFCTYCGAKQPVDRAAYEREHPELADALSDDELLEQQRQRQVIEAERRAHEEAERKVKEEVERKLREEAERKAKRDAERKAKEEAELNLVVCPNCGQKVSSDVNFCPNCAHPIALLKKEETEVESHQNPTLPPPLTDVDNNHYINVPPLPEEESTVLPPKDEQEDYFHCPICGAAVREGESSCISCGQVFDWSDNTPEHQSTPSQAYTTQSSDNNNGCSSGMRIALIVIAALFCILFAITQCSDSDSMTIENAEEYGNIVQENHSYDSNHDNDYNLETQRIADEAEANAKSTYEEAKANAERTYEEARANAERAYEEARIAAERAVNEARAASHYNYDDENYDDELDDEDDSSY